MRVGVVIPAYNEVSAITTTVRAIRELGDGYTPIVVDDGSTDGTADAAFFAGATILRHAINRGQGAALETGTRWALGERVTHIAHFDADGQMCADDIPRAILHLCVRGLDAILGSRALGEAVHMPASKRYALLPMARVVNWAFTGVWLSDAHNGFRVFTADAARLCVITQDRMAHATEIPYVLRRAGMHFAEMPVTVRYARYGQGVRGGMHIVGDLFLRWFE